jgi:hypothetical protein
MYTLQHCRRLPTSDLSPRKLEILLLTSTLVCKKLITSPNLMLCSATTTCVTCVSPVHVPYICLDDVTCLSNIHLTTFRGDTICQGSQIHSPCATRDLSLFNYRLLSTPQLNNLFSSLLIYLFVILAICNCFILFYLMFFILNCLETNEILSNRASCILDTQ